MIRAALTAAFGMFLVLALGGDVRGAEEPETPPPEDIREILENKDAIKNVDLLIDMELLTDNDTPGEDARDETDSNGGPAGPSDGPGRAGGGRGRQAGGHRD